MGQIQVLPDSLINRIAAGEVVDRPASAIKELLENAIDARASRVRISCEGGGARRIVVEDDGCGMDRDDALLAVERHATSKVRQAADLDAIRTLGFRGEALASIAAVSRMLLRTSTGGGVGTEVEIHAGRVRAVREIAQARGTTIEVARLFVNVPARRKFLRSESTELGHVTRAVTRCALAHPELRLELEHGGRPLLRLDPARSLEDRLTQVHGTQFVSRLLPVEHAGSGWRLHGLVGRPADAATSRDAQHLFVNGRWVQDRLLAHAIAEAYRNAIPAGRRPWLALALELDPDLVDVNVHPQKTEVRFRAPGGVHDGLRDALRRALSRPAVVPELRDLRPAAAPPVADVAHALERHLARVADGALRSGTHPPWDGARPDVSPSTLAEPSRPWGGRTVYPLAQYRQSYIVAADEEGLILVDQHAAHERVLFERYLAEASENRVETQRLLFPVTVELTPAECLLVAEEEPEFRRLGFELEPFGRHAIKVEAIPALAAELDPATLLRELVGDAARTRSATAGSPTLRLRLVTTAACRAAIKIHHPLSAPEMGRLLEDLFAAESPSTCPHGRPIVFRLAHEDIERAFRRR